MILHLLTPDNTRGLFPQDRVRDKVKKFATERKDLRYVLDFPCVCPIIQDYVLLCVAPSCRHKNIEKLVEILKGDDDDKYEQVFGDRAHLVGEYIEAAVVREMAGIEEGTTPQRRRKRVRGESSNATSDDVDQPVAKRPQVDEPEQSDADKPAVDDAGECW